MQLRENASVRPSWASRLAGRVQSTVLVRPNSSSGNLGRSVMRRTILFSFFLLAACGGGARPEAVNQAPDARQEAQAFLLTAGAQEAIGAFARSFDQDAIDTCLSAWLDEASAGGLSNEPIGKPNVAGLRAFLGQCLAASKPGNAQSGPVSVRKADTGHDAQLRTQDP